MIHTVTTTMDDDFLSSDERTFDIQRMIDSTMINKLATLIFNYYSSAIERNTDPYRRQTTHSLQLYVRSKEDLKRSMDILQEILEDNGLSESKSKDIVMSFKKYMA